MKDVTVTNQNIQGFFEELISEIDEHGSVICSTKTASTGCWGMARLWRAWMATTADFMAKNGVTMPLMVNTDGVTYSSRPFNSDDAHELFTRQHLGVDESGRRLSWAKSRKPENKDKERQATKGERWKALRDHESWASERGIILFKPRDSEYSKLTKQQSE